MYALAHSFEAAFHWENKVISFYLYNIDLLPFEAFQVENHVFCVLFHHDL